MGSLSSASRQGILAGNPHISPFEGGDQPGWEDQLWVLYSLTELLQINARFAIENSQTS